MFRFTIRDVLWLTVVVALGISLVIQHQSLLSANARISELEFLNRDIQRANSDLKAHTTEGREKLEQHIKESPHLTKAP